MLKKILQGKDCASCRICCIFDRYDLWETPIITDELAEIIEGKFPEIEFIYNKNLRMLKMSEAEDELYYCPMLDKEKGCILGDEKPFDCKIWPYRIMNFQGKQVISIASICPTMFEKSLKELTAFLDDGLAEKIFQYADNYPQAVKNYEIGYPILITRD